jgi:hypothetical protein
VKIGKSSVSVEKRVKQLDGTSVPLPFEIFATMKTVKYNEAEKLIHRYIERFTNLRIRDNREFFNVKPEDALAIFRDVAMVLDDAEIDEVYKKSVNPSALEASYKLGIIKYSKVEEEIYKSCKKPRYKEGKKKCKNKSHNSIDLANHTVADVGVNYENSDGNNKHTQEIKKYKGDNHCDKINGRHRKLSNNLIKHLIGGGGRICNNVNVKRRTSHFKKRRNLGNYRVGTKVGTMLIHKILNVVGNRRVYDGSNYKSSDNLAKKSRKGKTRYNLDRLCSHLKEAGDDAVVGASDYYTNKYDL